MGCVHLLTTEQLLRLDGDETRRCCLVHTDLCEILAFLHSIYQKPSFEGHNVTQRKGAQPHVETVDHLNLVVCMMLHR